jgi:serine protease AprX
MNGDQEHLPIKVVVTTEADLRRPHAGGGKAKDFSPRYSEVRESLLQDIGEVERFFDTAFTRSNLPAVARIQLSHDAIAKSHRPDSLLQRTCPIIGGENFGELLASVRPEAVRRLKQLVTSTTDAKLQSDIGKITSIAPYRPEDALGEWTVEQFARHLRQHRIREVKLRLFSHRKSDIDARLEHALGELVSAHGLERPAPLNYGVGLRLYRVKLPSTEAVADLAGFVGTQGLSVFEHFVVSTQATPIANISPDDLPPPEPETEYPVVGIIDSGTDPDNKFLQAWVVDRDETDVPRIDQDNNHGSLVTGLIVNGRGLNHDLPGFPPVRAKVVDVVAYPSTGVREDVLLDTIRRALLKYPKVKIWNLSLNSTNSHVVNERFSTFAIALDGVQDQFDVTIVNSAGNFLQRPAHPWPRPDLKQLDRILAPADSLRAITVGAQAHISHKGACAKVGEPAPFTRKGPGAAFVPKPEITHFGGNTNSSLHCTQMGIVSIDGAGRLAETVGTSFAAPLVAVTAAHLAHTTAEAPTRNLLKALIVHSAVLHSNEITAAELPFTGFGRPPEPAEILRCRPWEATLIFQLDLPYAKRTFHKLDFPIPGCLHKDGKVSGEVTLTLVYDPPTDPGDGAAYSQVNVDCSLGTCSANAWDEDYGGEKSSRTPKTTKSSTKRVRSSMALSGRR